MDGVSIYQFIEVAEGTSVMRLPDEPFTLNLDVIVCTPLVPNKSFCTPDAAVRVPQYNASVKVTPDAWVLVIVIVEKADDVPPVVTDCEPEELLRTTAP